MLFATRVILSPLAGPSASPSPNDVSCGELIKKDAFLNEWRPSVATAGRESVAALPARPICTLERAGIRGRVRKPFGRHLW